MEQRSKISDHLRSLREARGLTHGELGAMINVSTPSIWDLESFDDELISVYGVRTLRLYAAALATTALGVLNAESGEPPISWTELSKRVIEHCETAQISVSDFEDRVGWKLAGLLEAPAKFEEDISLDGLKDLCCALSIDWYRLLKEVSQADPAVTA